MIDETIDGSDFQPARKTKKKKTKVYLEHSRIIKYLQDNYSNAVNGRGHQAYVLASTSIYDEWVRLNYDLQVWQQYLTLKILI